MSGRRFICTDCGREMLVLCEPAGVPDPERCNLCRWLVKHLPEELRDGVRRDVIAAGERPGCCGRSTSAPSAASHDENGGL